jgi:FMN-dependent NADH-azoreductase
MHYRLVTNKKMLIITSRGGSYRSETDSANLDFQEPYLRAVFEFIGITDITFIHAENLTMGDEFRQRSLTTARTAIQSLLSTW